MTSEKRPRSIQILSLPVDLLTMDEVLDKVVEYVETGARPCSIFAVNPEKSITAPKDTVLRSAMCSADVIIPDGIGVVLAARILHAKRIQRITGVDLMQRICDLAAQKGYRVFLYGAKEEVNKKAAAQLQRKFPGLQVAGRCNGYIAESEMGALIERINELRAQILFLALGSPKQELWFAKHKDALTTVRVCQGIGGTLDAITGQVKRAPRIVQKLGLEWLYRLATEPKRAKRQAALPIFAWMVLKARLRASLGMPGAHRGGAN
ncbi:MAG: WecB/TagA/CpsF family glycosyltransferase [Deltaproteobacteria bacterium]|nr:WecB/TagA/CpsF family glycosyltransferase [Deltaproteobacteria bacterium]